MAVKGRWRMLVSIVFIFILKQSHQIYGMYTSKQILKLFIKLELKYNLYRNKHFERNVFILDVTKKKL